MVIDGETIELEMNDVEIQTEDIPGWVIASSGNITVALDVTLTTALINEGIARELVNRIQNIRKDKNYEVTDKIVVVVEKHDGIVNAIQNNFSYICSEILAASLTITEQLSADKTLVELTDEISTFVSLKKFS